MTKDVTIMEGVSPDSLFTGRPSGSAKLATGARLEPDFSRMIRVPGGEVYVRVNGNLKGGKPPIVLIHGGPGSSHWYFLNATALADERAVILYDQLDSGLSDHPDNPSNWHINRFVEELEDIASALDIDCWHVLGTSWGSVIALEYAVLSERMASLILSSPAISTNIWLRDCDRLIELMPPSVREILRSDATLTDPRTKAVAAAIDVYHWAHVQRLDAPEEVKQYQRRMPETFNPSVYNFMWGPEEFVATGSLKDYDAMVMLEMIDGRRTLFLAGEHDEARPSTVARLASTAGGSFREIKDAAHLLMNDNPDACLLVLRSWLAQMDEPGTRWGGNG